MSELETKEEEIEVKSIEELDPEKLYLIKVKNASHEKAYNLSEAMRGLGVKGLIVDENINFFEIQSLFEDQTPGVKEKILKALQ